jgi:hypothetical protein
MIYPYTTTHREPLATVTVTPFATVTVPALIPLYPEATVVFTLTVFEFKKIAADPPPPYTAFPSSSYVDLLAG